MSTSSLNINEIKGTHDKEDLMKSLDEFIEKYILCQKCRLPEVQLLVGGDIRYRCFSCGDQRRIEQSESKIYNFILKNYKNKQIGRQVEENQEKINLV